MCSAAADVAATGLVKDASFILHYMAMDKNITMRVMRMAATDVDASN